MRSRRGSTYWTSTLSGHLNEFQAGDIVQSTIVSLGHFYGSVRSVDRKCNKVMVAWGGGSLVQHDPDELQIVPFSGEKRMASRRGADIGRLMEAGKKSKKDTGKWIEKTRYREMFELLGKIQHGTITDKEQERLKEIARETEQEMQEIAKLEKIKVSSKSACSDSEPKEESLISPLMSRRDYGLAASRVVKAELTLSDKDKAVLDAFSDGKPAESKKLSTDGKRLDGNWMGGDGLATRSSDGTVTPGEGRPHVKSDEVVLRALKKIVPSRYYKATEKVAKDLPQELEKHKFTEEKNPNPKGNDRDKDGKKGEEKPFEASKRMRAKDLPQELEKHKFTEEKNPNPKGNDRDKDGKKGEEKPFEASDLRSRRAMYHSAPGRMYRLTRSEQECGLASCPICREEMRKDKFVRGQGIYLCDACGFKVTTDKVCTEAPVIEVDPADDAVVASMTRRGRMALDADEAEANPQYVGDPDVNGLDDPRRGGFGIMQDLVKDQRESFVENKDPKTARRRG